MHAQGEYDCLKCGRRSNIVYRGAVYAWAVGCSAAGAMVTIGFSLFGGEPAGYPAFFVLLPFLLFYALAPFWMRFERLPVKRPAPAGKQNARPGRVSSTTARMTGNFRPQRTAPRPENAPGRREVPPPRRGGQTPPPRPARPPAGVQRSGAQGAAGRRQENFVPPPKKDPAQKKDGGFDPFGEQPEDLKDILNEFIERYGEDGPPPRPRGGRQ